MKLLDKSARSRSQKSDATTVTLSSSSNENAAVQRAPKKPQRVKSGYLFDGVASEEQPRRKESCDHSEKDSKSVTEQGHAGIESDDGEDKWCALKDSNPDSAKRRVRRVIRTNSDSDLSEASTIDSSSGVNNKGKSRKGEIRARNRERKARQAERAAAKDGKQVEEYQEPDLDEDEDLVDTDKDMPMSELNEQLALRKKRADARRSPKNLRGKSPHSDTGGRVKSTRRAGKKEEILTAPNVIDKDDHSNTKSISKKRQTNPDKIRGKTKSGSGDTFLSKEHTVQQEKPLTRSASADVIGKRNANQDHMRNSSGFKKLLNDSRKDFMLNTAALRHENDSWHNLQLPAGVQDPLSRSHENRKETGRRSLSPTPDSNPRRDMLSKSRKPQSDRFLCVSTTSDFAPKLSSRHLNVSGDDYERTPKTNQGKSLDSYVITEESKVKKSKKSSARSVDDISKRRKPKS